MLKRVQWKRLDKECEAVVARLDKECEAVVARKVVLLKEKSRKWEKLRKLSASV